MKNKYGISAVVFTFIPILALIEEADSPIKNMFISKILILLGKIIPDVIIMFTVFFLFPLTAITLSIIGLKKGENDKLIAIPLSMAVLFLLIVFIMAPLSALVK